MSTPARECYTTIWMMVARTSPALSDSVRILGIRRGIFGYATAADHDVPNALSRQARTEGWNDVANAAKLSAE